jgi:glycosyltransferase involved in cell wall biosynthesis
MLRVTVIVPTCERPDLLMRALESVRSQAAPPAEVIVVNDAPPEETDRIRSVVAPLGVRGMRVVSNAHSKGASGARNTGADLATGDVLAFLDDDDDWLPAYLGAALHQFESEGSDMLCTDLLYRFGDGVERPGKRAPDTLAVDAFLTRNPGLVGSNIMMRRSLYRNVGGFDESLPTYEDVDFGIRLSLHGAVRYRPLHKPLVRHYHHAGPRLCTPRTDAMRAGVRRFYALHGHRMSQTQREQFRSEMHRLWGIDEQGCDIE